MFSSVGVPPRYITGYPEISAHSRQVPEVDYESGRFPFLHFLAHVSVMSTPFTFALSLWFLHFAAETKKYWVYNFRQ